MINTKKYFKNIIPIIAALLTLTTAVVLLQKDAMVSLGFCNKGDTLCVILANIGTIAGLTAIMTVVLLTVVALPDLLVLSFKYMGVKFKSYIQMPNFKNVKVSFIGDKTNEISIQVHNKEWRYPTISVEALCTGNLKWKSTEKSDVAVVKKFRKIDAPFIKARMGKLYLESRRDSPKILETSEGKLEVVLYITIGKIRISRPFFVDVKYEGKNQISITNITILQDIVQKPSPFNMIELE